MVVHCNRYTIPPQLKDFQTGFCSRIRYCNQAESYRYLPPKNARRNSNFTGGCDVATSPSRAAVMRSRRCRSTLPTRYTIASPPRHLRCHRFFFLFFRTARKRRTLPGYTLSASALPSRRHIADRHIRRKPRDVVVAAAAAAAKFHGASGYFFFLIQRPISLSVRPIRSSSDSSPPRDIARVPVSFIESFTHSRRQHSR